MKRGKGWVERVSAIPCRNSVISKLYANSFSLRRGMNLRTIGGGAYWAGRAVVRPLFVPSGQALLLALPLFCLKVDFSSISY